jgi:hypothetical protein
VPAVPVRILAMPCVLAALALTSGCGKSKEEKYRDQVAPLNGKIEALVRGVGRAARAASKSSDKQIQGEFGAFARRATDLQGDVKGLEPPNDVKLEQRNLVRALGSSRAALTGVGKAAGRNSVTGARAATLALVVTTVRLDQARVRWARAASG